MVAERCINGAKSLVLNFQVQGKGSSAERRPFESSNPNFRSVCLRSTAPYFSFFVASTNHVRLERRKLASHEHSPGGVHFTAFILS